MIVKLGGYRFLVVEVFIPVKILFGLYCIAMGYFQVSLSLIIGSLEKAFVYFIYFLAFSYMGAVLYKNTGYISLYFRVDIHLIYSLCS